MIPAGERPAWIESTLREAFEPEHLELCDESYHHEGHPGAAGGGHYRVTIVSGCFGGRPLIARHRMVYDALGGAMKSDIHALVVRAFTPEEWARESG